MKLAETELFDQFLNIHYPKTAFKLLILLCFFLGLTQLIEV